MSLRTRTKFRSLQVTPPSSLVPQASHRDSLATNNWKLAFLSNSLNVEPQIPRASDGIMKRHGLVSLCVRRTTSAASGLDGDASLRRFIAFRFEQPLRHVPFVLGGLELDGRPWFGEKDGSISSRFVEAGDETATDWRLRLPSRHRERTELHLW